MFRRLEGGLTPDAKFPEELEGLGYKLTDDHKIRMIGRPERGFRYRITNNERYNDMQQEALQAALRKEVVKRMKAMGYVMVYAPQMISVKPRLAHIPILSTPLDTLKEKNRVIIVINDYDQDLGIWSWRDITYTPEGQGLESGSCVSLARVLQARHTFKKGSLEEPGLIILNPGQTAFSWKKNTALTLKSWRCLPRSSLNHPSVFLDPQWNVVEGHKDAEDHVRSMLDALLSGTAYIKEDAEVYIITQVGGATMFYAYLQNHLNNIADRVRAVQFVCPYFADPEFREGEVSNFMQERCRSLQWSLAPGGTPIGAPYHVFQPDRDGYVEPSSATLTFSTGDAEACAFREAIFSRVYDQILDWFDEVAIAVSTNGRYINPVMAIEQAPIMSDTHDHINASSEATVELAQHRLPSQIGRIKSGTTSSLDVQTEEDKRDSETPEDAIAMQTAELGLHDTKAVAKPPSDGKIRVAGVDVEKSLLERAGLI